MSHAKILIVEDEALVARDIQRSLERLGYSVAAIADNALDAINLAKQLKPELIVMDISLKGPMDGIEAAAKISTFARIPFIYLTAHQDEEILERSKATRPYGFLLKPMNERDLNSCVRMALYRFDTERRLKESEERYFRLADNARDMIFRMSLVNGIYEYVNKACTVITGYSRDDFYNTPMFITKIIHPDWQEYFNSEWQKLKDGSAAPVYEYQIISKSGDIRWLNQRNVLIKNEDGVPNAIEGIVTDITEQKQAEMLLTQQREEYRLMFEAIPAMVLVKNTENRIIKANTLAAEFLDISLDKLEGRYINELFPNNAETYLGEDKIVLSTGQPLLSIVEEFSRNGKGNVWLKYDKYPYRNDKGDIVGVIVMAQDITDQKKMELALKQSEGKYKNLTKNAPVAFTRLIIGENKYEIVNNEFEKQSGYTLDEFNNLTGEEYQNLMHPEDRASVMSQYREWVKGGCAGIKNLVYRIINKYGKTIWLDSYHYADYSSDGSPVAINQLYFNINDRIESENILRESKQYLDAFFAQSLDGIFIAKTSVPVLWNSTVNKDETLDFIFGDIRLTKVNEPLCEQFGMTTEAALKVHPLEYYKGNMGPVRDRWKRFLDEGYLHINEYFKKQTGEDIFIEGDYYCLYDSKRNFIGYLGIQRDMTQRKIAEEKIRLSEEKFRAVAEAIPAQVVIFQENKFVYVNPYSETITGYTADEMLRMNFWDLVHEDYVGIARERGLARQEGKSVPDNYEMKIITKSGGEKWINYSARVIDFNGKPAVIGTSTDITEKKIADEALKKSLKEKEILLKEIHHRVKNNLQIVTSLLKLQSSYVKDEGVRRLFQESQNRVQSMSLIHQKLYQTKDLSHIDFRDYVETVVVHLQHSFGILEDRVKICVDVQDIIMSIDNAIPAGLIINELVSNSLKHAFPAEMKGSIYINLAYDKHNREYWLVVRDNGIGMPKNLDIQTTNSFGLKLVLTLVKQMSGFIEIVSAGGSEYRIIFKSSDYKERN